MWHISADDPWYRLIRFVNLFSYYQARFDTTVDRSRRNLRFTLQSSSPLYGDCFPRLQGSH